MGNSVDTQYLNSFEEQLLETLVKQLHSAGHIGNELLASEDLDNKWTTSAPSYMAAVVPQIAEYPLVAIAWAGYLGMGAAVLWDTDWESYQEREDLFTLISSHRGFDEMDEYVVEGLLGHALESEEAKKIEDIMRNCAITAQNRIRKEQVEAQSITAFHIFARTTKVLYRIGVSLGLSQMGYSYAKVIASQGAN